jgi:Arc/MetJ family transcription regulator
VGWLSCPGKFVAFSSIKQLHLFWREQRHSSFFYKFLSRKINKKKGGIHPDQGWCALGGMLKARPLLCLKHNRERGRALTWDKQKATLFRAGEESGYLETNNFCLTCMHISCILIHMRTTLNIDDKILEKASRLTGVKEKTSLVRLGLESLIARESSKRLAKLGGTEKNLRSTPRRRSV